MLQSKLTTYKDAVSEAGNGFAPMSMSKAKKEILGMSNDENSLQFPYVETKENYHSTINLGIEIIKGKPKLKILKGYL